MSFDWIGQEDAASKQQKATRDTNRTNLLLSIVSRGGAIDAATAHKLGLPPSFVGKSSAILPYYLSDFEQSSGKAAGNMSQALMDANGSGADQVNDINELLGHYGNDFTAADKMAGDILSGRVTDDMLREAQPVFDARTEAGQVKKNAALEQLGATLNSIDAIQAKKGFSGDSTANQMLQFQARRGIATEGAKDLSDAKLQNALEKAGLQSQGRNLTISNLDLPDRLARAAVARRSLPGQSVSSRFQTALSPLSFFNLGPHNFSQFEKEPTTPSGLGLAAQGLGSAATTAGNYWLQRDLQNRNNSAGTNGGGWGSGGGGGSAWGNVPASEDWSNNYGNGWGDSGVGGGYSAGAGEFAGD